MKQSPMPVAALVSFTFIPTFRHVLPTIRCRHVNHPSDRRYALATIEFAPKHEIDGSRHTQTGPEVRRQYRALTLNQSTIHSPPPRSLVTSSFA
jgi:hypothetical protein